MGVGCTSLALASVLALLVVMRQQVGRVGEGVRG
jgi:hypothetical protein